MIRLSDVRYLPEHFDHAPAADAIAAEAFGPGRKARAAERVRELVPHRRDLSFVAMLGGEIVGTVRQTPVAVGIALCLMLGPLAVRPAYKGMGIGRRLMAIAADAARQAGEGAIILVGDRAYYEPLGYRGLPVGSVEMPGPVDRARILGLELVPGGLDALRGMVGARRA